MHAYARQDRESSSMNNITNNTENEAMTDEEIGTSIENNSM